jgi:hypothetical protein
MTVTPDPTPAPVVVPGPPPLPADVTSVGWWQAITAWAVTTAAWVAVLVGHPFGSTTLTEVTTAAGIVASIAPIVAALITHGQVKKAVIGYHAAALQAAAGQSTGVR